MLSRLGGKSLRRCEHRVHEEASLSVTVMHPMVRDPTLNLPLSLRQSTSVNMGFTVWNPVVRAENLFWAGRDIVDRPSTAGVRPGQARCTCAVTVR